MKRILAALLVISLLPFITAGKRWIPWTTASSAVLATFSDNFNRANETPLSGGGAWITGNGVTQTINLVSSTLAQGSTSSDDNFGSVVTPIFANNQQSTITLNSTTDTGTAVRVQSATNPACYLALLLSSTSVQIYKQDSSFNSTALGAAFTITAVTAGTTISLSATGTTTTTLTLYRNGVSQGTRTDSSSPLTGGQPGMFMSSTQSIDAFSATDL